MIFHAASRARCRARAAGRCPSARRHAAAKKEFEDRLAREAEDRRLSAIPKWKRDLIARKEEAECKMK